MKLQIDRAAFVEAMGRVSPAVPTRSPKPVLECVKLRATPDGVTLTASDLEVGITCTVGPESVHVETPGAVLLPTAKVAAVLKASRDEWLTLELRDDQLIITGEHSEYEFPTEPAEHFPDVPAFDAWQYRVVAAADLKRLIRRTIFATDESSTRYSLGGVCFSAENGTLRAVATDGRRLSLAECPADAEGEPEPPRSPVIPVKALKLLDRNLDDDESPVHVAFGGTSSANESALVRTDRVTIYSRLVDGRFPAWESILPGDSTTRATADAGALLAASEQAAIATSEESRGVTFAFTRDTLTLSGKAPDRGRSNVTMALATDGPDVILDLDPRYLNDALRALPGDCVATLHLIDDRSALVLKADDGRYCAIVMPLTRDR